MVDKNTQRSRGFGFVTFISEDTVEKVMEDKEIHQLNGKWIDCKKALPVTSQVLQKAKKEKQVIQKANAAIDKIKQEQAKQESLEAIPIAIEEPKQI